MGDEPSLPPAQAAAYLGVGLKFLRRLDLPNVGTSTRKRYAVADLDAWLVANGTSVERKSARVSQQFTKYRRVTMLDGTKMAASRHPYFEEWRSVLRRVSNPDDPNYAGRGIGMHEPWQEDPAAFCEYLDRELDPRPKYVTRDGKVRWCSLDRIDNDKGYLPGNLRWADASTQNANRRSWAAATRLDWCLCSSCPGEEHCQEKQRLVPVLNAFPHDLRLLSRRLARADEAREVQRQQAERAVLSTLTAAELQGDLDLINW